MHLIAAFIAFMTVQVLAINIDDWSSTGTTLAAIDLQSQQSPLQLVSTGNLLAQTETTATGPRSIDGSVPIDLVMENRSGKEVQLYWYDYNGNPRPYDPVAVGQILKRPTMATHPWEARPTDGSNTQFLIDGQAVYGPIRIVRQKIKECEIILTNMK